MSTLRAIVAIAIPSVTAMLGLLWLFGRKKPPSIRKPPDKSTENIKAGTSQKENEKRSSLSINGSAGKPSGKSDADVVSLQTSVHKPNNSMGNAGEAVAAHTSRADPKVAGKDSNNSSSKHFADEAPTIIEEAVVSSLQASLQSSQSALAPTTAVNGATVEHHSHVESKPSESAIVRSVEQLIMPCKSDSVPCAAGDASPKPDHSRTSNLPHSKLSNASQSENLSRNNVNAVEEGTISASVSGSKSAAYTNTTPSDSMSRSWHDDIPDSSKDVNDLHCNSVGALKNDKTGFENSKATPVSKTTESENGSEQNCSDEEMCPPHILVAESKASTSDGPSTSGNKQSGKQTEQHNQSENSANCDNLSEASNDSGKGGSVHDNSNVPPPDEEKMFEFNIPSHICGLFIGSHGKTIKSLSSQSGTKLRLQPNPYTTKYQICVVEGTQSAIDKARSIIKRKFPTIKFPGPESSPTNPVIMPEIMQFEPFRLGLPEGVSVDIVVSSIVDAGRIFVQQPTHPTFPSLERLNTFMNGCYMQDGAIPSMPKPIETGVICAAPMLNGWYRAQIMATCEGTDEVDIKYVDYGGYSRVSSQILKQIRSDFMTLPFEAVECYLANITPIEADGFFSTEAAVVLEELTQGKLLQAQMVGRAEDGIPFINVFQIQPNNVSLLVNREMVNRGVVKWMENMG